MAELLFGTKLGRRDFPGLLYLEPQAVELHTTKDDLLNHLSEFKKIAKEIDLPKAVHIPDPVDGVLFNLKRHASLVEKCIELSNLIIVHPCSEKETNHRDMLDDFLSSLSFFENKGVKVAIENAPGWHTSVFPHKKLTICKDIDDFKELFRSWPDYSMCFDVCHAAMQGQDIKAWFRELGKRMIHLHFSDSKNGKEGLQIGDGDIDWVEVVRCARKYCSGRIIVIPEILDGHLENGAGFKIALDRLRKLY